MTIQDRRQLRRIAGVGALLTLVVACLDGAGALEGVERRAYDGRARVCQAFTPTPTTQVAHVDIDDAALQAVGRWPWPREAMARAVDEIARAGASTVLLDVVFPEPQEPRWEPRADGAFARVDDDADLAASVGRAGRCLVPVSLTFEPPGGPGLAAAFAAARAELSADPELTPAEVAERARARAGAGGAGETRGRAVAAEDVARVFLAARERAVYDRIAAEPDAAAVTADAMCERVLVRDAGLAGSPLVRLIRQQHRKVLAVRAMGRLSRAAGPGLPPLLAADDEHATVAGLSDAAAATAFVDYLPDPDGVVRSVPVWVLHRGRLVPQAGFATACAHLGVDPRDPAQVEITPDRVILHPPARRPVTIPLVTRDTKFGRRGGFMDIPWVGGPRWQSLYAGPGDGGGNDGGAVGHVSINLFLELARKREALARNNATADRALRDLLASPELGQARRAAELAAAPPPPADDFAPRTGPIDEALAEARDYADPYRRKPKSEWDDQARAFMRAHDAVEMLRRRTPELQQDVAALAGELRDRIQGRAVIVGFTGSAMVDRVPTSLHPDCPGSVVHGTIVNAILTGQGWRRASRWADLAATAGVGLLATAAALLSPWRALAVSGLLAGGYAALNGWILFDYADFILGVTGPLAAVTAVWGGCTLLRVVGELSERIRVTRRFRAYVDPKLVDYVLGNPDRVRLDGQLTELTMVFTDLAGFTTLAEQLKERAVPVLGEYMSLMVPVIRRRRGLVNKFIGDGLFFFFNAPEPNPDHAADAVAVVLEMHQAVAVLNERLAARGLPRLGMRAGINTGVAVVGDSGPADACEYTALGDAVNLTARLESANKAVGTRSLLTARTAELLDGRYLLRPVGRITVVGKREHVMTYEPVCPAADATPAQRAAADRAAGIVALFQAGRFRDCIELIDAAPDGGEPDKLAGLYRALSAQYLESPPVDFDGQITLGEK